MKKQWKIILLLTLFVLLIGSYVYVKNKPKKIDEPQTSKIEQVLTIDKGKIKKVTLVSDTYKVELNKSGSNWVTTDSKVEINQTAVDSVLSAISDLKADRVVEEDAKDLASYGLTKPTATITATLEGGETKTVFLGKDTHVGNSYFLSLKDSTKVYAVLSAYNVPFQYKLEDFKNKNVGITFDPSKLTYLKITPLNGKPFEVKLSSNQDEQSKQYGINSHIITMPYSYNIGLDNSNLQPLLQVIPSISPDEVIEDAPTDLDKYGLKNPVLELLAKDADKGEVHIYFGKDKDSNNVYFKSSTKNAVYTISKDVMKKLNIEPFSVATKFSYIVNIDTVDKLVIEGKGRTHTITFTRTLSKKAEKAGASDEYSTVYKIDDKAIEEETFKNFYQTVVGLTLDSEINKTVDEKASYTTTFYLNTGDKKPVTVKYSEYDADFYATFIDGKSNFIISKEKLSSMFDGLEKLIK